MVDFFVRKIKEHGIYKKTGQPWSVEDVPLFWRADVEIALAKK